MTADGAALGTVAPGAGVAEAHRRIRERIGMLGDDREPGPDLATAFDLVHGGALADLADPDGTPVGATAAADAGSR